MDGIHGWIDGWMDEAVGALRSSIQNRTFGHLLKKNLPSSESYLAAAFLASSASKPNPPPLTFIPGVVMPFFQKKIGFL